MLREDGRRQGDAVIGALAHGVCGVPQQPVDRVVPVRLGEVQLLAHAVPPPNAVFDPVRPRHQDAAGSERRRLSFGKRLDQLHTADAEEPEAPTHLG